jgi:hypothetical protein
MSHDQDLRARTGSPPEAWPSTPPPGTSATGRTGQGQDSQAHAGAPGIGGQEWGDPGQPGTCYLLHSSEPYRHARHYSGSATDPRARTGRGYRDPRFAARRRTLHDTPARTDECHE